MAKSITRIDAKKPDLLQRKRVAAYARVSMDTERYTTAGTLFTPVPWSGIALCGRRASTCAW